MDSTEAVRLNGSAGHHGKVPFARSSTNQAGRLNTTKVAAPLPRSAHHAVTLASLVGNDEETDELNESEVAQAHEAYSYTRAVLAHLAGDGGSTPPPAPSSGMRLGSPLQPQPQPRQSQQAANPPLTSPSLTASSFSTPSTPSLSSPSRPRSSSTRNSFSSIGPPPSLDYERASWGGRPSSLGLNTRRQEVPTHHQSQGEIFATPRQNQTSQSYSSPGPSVASPSLGRAIIAAPHRAGAGVARPTSMTRHRGSMSMQDGETPMADGIVETAIGSSSTSVFQPSAPLLTQCRSPSPLLQSEATPATPPARKRNKERTRSASHQAELESISDFGNEGQTHYSRIAKGRSSSWQPDWPPLSSLRHNTTRAARPVKERGRTPAPLSLVHSSHHSHSMSEEVSLLKPVIQSAPISEAEAEMIERLRLHEDQHEALFHPWSRDSKRSSLGSRRKSIEFAVKAMGKWARRKNSTSTLGTSDLHLNRYSGRADSLGGEKSAATSGFLDQMQSSAKTSASSFRLDGDDWKYPGESDEHVAPLPSSMPALSSSPTPQHTRRFSSASAQQRLTAMQQISHPISSSPHTSTPDVGQVDVDALEEVAGSSLHRLSSRLARIESLTALSGAFKKGSESERGQEEEEDGVVYSNASTPKGIMKILRDIPVPLMKKRSSHQHLPSPLPMSPPPMMSGQSTAQASPAIALEGERNSVTPTQIRSSTAARPRLADEVDEAKEEVGDSASCHHRPSATSSSSSSPRPRGGPFSSAHQHRQSETEAMLGNLPASSLRGSEAGQSTRPQSPASSGARLARRSYSALVHAFSAQPHPDSSSLPIIKASGDQQQGGEPSTPNGAMRSGGAPGSGGFNGMGSYGWAAAGSGGGGGMSGGEGGGGGRTPGGGGGYTGGRTSPPIQSVFRRLELVGRGAYGAVYRGVHVASGAAVALKVVNLDTPEDDVSDIQREVTLFSQLRETSAKNVVKYWGCWLKGSELWIVMDFAEGGSVRTLMKAGPIAEKYSVVIVRESLVALGYLHKSGIIHRDIKAANILLTTSGKVLLCDFGVAASLVSSSVHSKRSTFVGTPYWMAPEVITQGKTYDQSADIWSLGITIYEMVTGNPPLSDQEQMRAIMLIPKSKPPRLPAEGAFSNLLREFVGLCLNEEPKERPSADELAKSKWIKASSKVPNSILRDLISSYAAWTKGGGMRMSLIGAEANDLNEANNRDSFAFDGIDGDEGWEFNTVNSRSMDWHGEQVSTHSSAPLRDHPLLRLFQDGEEDVQTPATRGQATTGTSSAKQPSTSTPAPNSTYKGADIRPAPLPPGPIPDRPPLAALTSAGLAADKGSFTGMGATPFRFGGGGPETGSSPVPTSPLHFPPEASAMDDNGGAETSLANSSFGFHQSGNSSSRNTSFSMANTQMETSKDSDATSMLPPSAPFRAVHQRDGSGLSAVSSSGNEGGGRAAMTSKQRQGTPSHSRNDSASFYSHSRDRSETSASANMSVASERRTGNNQTPLPSTPLPLNRPQNEGMREVDAQARGASSEAGGSAFHRQQPGSAPAYPSQRTAQMGIRSRSGSRSKPIEGSHLDHDWSGTSHSHPPLPNRNTPASSRRPPATVTLPHPDAIDVSSAVMHQRRQHGGSDPTQLLNRASQDLSPRQGSSTLHSDTQWRTDAHPSSTVPRLRPLDLNTLVERQDVHLELERTVEDLGSWLDLVGTGLAEITAK